MYLQQKNSTHVPSSMVVSVHEAAATRTAASPQYRGSPHAYLTVSLTDVVVIMMRHIS